MENLKKKLTDHEISFVDKKVAKFQKKIDIISSLRNTLKSKILQKVVVESG